MPRLRDPESHAETRRAQILAEAIQVFGEKGYHAANIADIARRLGLGHGTFYRYFRSKLDIFDAIVDGIVAAIGALVLEEAATHAESLEEYRAQLRRIGSRFLSIFAANERLARLVFYEGIAVDPAVGAKIRGIMDAFAGYTAAYLENGKRRGFLRADVDAEVTARAINAMIFESIEHIARSDDPRAAGDRWQSAIIALMLDGMGAHRAAPSTK
ncbi:MAG: TetR/AcrR family transcriptional regulator [Polyangiaceae bacterium]|nr:TetR/AcrR family transcriptional regulator [Polyangiaceae bacterium]